MAYPQETFSQTAVSPESLLGRRRQVVSSSTLMYQLDVLKQTGRYDAFKLQWHPSYNDTPTVWPIPNHLFWDSDIFKWIEGAAYFLKQRECADEGVESAVVELVDMIKGAQEHDGYLNLHFTVVQPGQRFTNLRDFHELYNAGHLIEAALAHQDAFGNDILMDVTLKYVSLLSETFGRAPTQIPGYPGHPEIELALLRLYARTANPKHLELARYFLTERGNPNGFHGRHFYDVEAERRNDDPNKRPVFYPENRCLWYHQAHLPLAEQETIEGHSVRAMYLLAAAADLVRVNPQGVSKQFAASLHRLWQNMVDRKMYLTGGIGAIKQWEGFGKEYYLPQGSDDGGCYSETCAAIGVMMLAERLSKLTRDGSYIDILELCLYNAILTSMSADGMRFTYVNQLASSDDDPSRREEWFTCACCPPNVLRFFGQLGGYIWHHKVEPNSQLVTIIVDLYVPATLQFQACGTLVTVAQESDWPWDGNITFSVSTPLRTVALKLRIPAWAPSFQISPHCPDTQQAQGYVELPPVWVSNHPTFTLSIPVKPRIIMPPPMTGQSTLSLARGPVVYCVEDVDNPWVSDHFKTTQLAPMCRIDEMPSHDSRSGDSFVKLIVREGASITESANGSAAPYVELQDGQESRRIEDLQFIPYFFRANRGGRGQMRVGLQTAPAHSGGAAQCGIHPPESPKHQGPRTSGTPDV